MKSKYAHLKDKEQGLKDTCTPEFFRLAIDEDKRKFDELIGLNPVFLFDEIYDQLKELMKIRNPAVRLTDDDYRTLIDKQLNGKAPDHYGVWVFYPWCRRVVHILDEQEFIEVRTSRNQYKITVTERDILATKKVGVIGLSVGQSVALTMAMERSFQEIRLADFDVLELTNLNRIRTGIHNLGTGKVVIVAREIAELDPFLKIRIYPDGLTEANMDAYFTEGGKLDVLIDECDGVDMKILCRHKAKALQVPVLMEASDRTTIDVERFDLEPNRSILHGFIDHLDVSKLKYLKTNEERVPYLAPMVGIDTMSVRLKASAIEVGQSITTWPQLASAVALGGGAIADIWRRIALGQYHESGRYFVDMEEIAGDKKNEPEYNIDDHIPVKPISDAEAIYAAGQAPLIQGGSRLMPAADVIKEIVAAASAAPSGGNSQPWKWVYKDGTLTLLHDQYYSWSFMDFQDRSSYIALGAAVENLVLKTHRSGMEVAISYFPVANDKKVIASFTFYPGGTDIPGMEPHVEDDLAACIEHRHTNRKIAPGGDIAPAIIDEMKVAGETISGANVSFFTSKEDREEIGDIISVTDKYRLLYPQSHNDFTYQEMRWTEEDAQVRRTGMDVNTLELLPSELVGLRLIKDPKVVDFVRQINGGNVFRNVSKKAMNCAYAAGFLTMPGFSELDHINGGRAAQRVWLKATQRNIAFHVMNVPFAFFARLQHDTTDLPVEIIDDLKKQYARFINITHAKENRGAIYLFRVFNSENPTVAPFRRLSEEVLVFA
jgi:molybdopterin/thiamine biosynthesis adenylyltransferase